MFYRIFAAGIDAQFMQVQAHCVAAGPESVQLVHSLWRACTVTEERHRSSIINRLLQNEYRI